MKAEREREQDHAAPAAALRKPEPAAAAPSSAAGVMALQRLVGNAAVAEMLETGGAERASAGAVDGAAADAAGPANGAAQGATQGAAAGAAGGAIQEAEGGIFELVSRGEAAIGSVWDRLTGQGASGAAQGAETAGGAAGAAAAGEAQGAEAAAGGPAGAAAAAGAAQGAEAAAGGPAGAAAGAAAKGAEGAAGGGAAGAAGKGAADGGAGGGAAGAAGKGAADGGAGGGAAGAAAKGAEGAAGGGAAGAGAKGAEGGAGGGAAGAAGKGAADGADGGAGGGAAAEAAPKREPGEDPNFQAMKGKAGAAAGSAKAHQPAAAGAAAAQAASVPPGNEVASQAQGAQVEEMGKQQPGTFDRAAFVAAVKKAIDKAAPKNLEEADDFKGSGKVGQAKDEVQGLVKGGKKDAEKDIKQATEAPPDTSKATPKPVAPLTPDEPGQAPASVGAAQAMPGPRPPEDTDLSEGPKEVDQQMVDAEVTEEQLQSSNEPDFNAALDARQEAHQHATTAPAEYRQQEAGILAKGQEEAAQVEGAQLKGMQSSKLEAIAKVAGAKGETKSQDESKRTKVANDIQAIYDRTKNEVTGILNALDGKVEATFTRGEASARKQFEDYVGAKMDAYKDDRYSGWFGGARWLKDKLFGMPDEVNVFYTDGRTGYLTAMDAVIGEVADLVGNELNAARMKIAAGRAEVHDYVVQLPQELQKVGKDAESKLNDQWDSLNSDIDSKQDSMVDSLAQKYVQSRDALDERIEELKAANKGLVAKAIDAVVGVIKTILKLKDMLLNVLAKAASVIGDIISDPIGFLSNLVDGIKTGLSNFVGNIARHLEEGFMNWLFGALGDAGITLPKTFDLEGIFGLVMDVLGLSYRAIRGRVAKIVGEPVVAKMESTVDVFKTLMTKGVAGLWEWIKDKVGDFQELVFGGIKDFIIERVIKGGIMWLLGLLNPAAAFIKACKAIYDIVMFIVERGAQIMEFVNSVLDSIGAIAKGNLSAAAQKVEDSLAKALPLAIGFLASLLGLGGISDKIREGIDKVRKPIEKAVDFVVLGAVKGFKKLFGGAIGWVKGKYEKGKAFVKEKWEAGKAKAKAAVLGGDDTPEGKQARLDKGVAAAQGVADRYAGKMVGKKILTALFAPIRLRYGLTKLEPVEDGDEWAVEGAVNPTKKDKTQAKIEKQLKDQRDRTRGVVDRVGRRIAELNASKTKNALAKLGDPGAATWAKIEALKKRLEKSADDPKKSQAEFDKDAIKTADTAGLTAIETAWTAISGEVDALDTEIAGHTPGAGEDKTSLIRPIVGAMRAGREAWRDEGVKALFAADSKAQEHFEGLCKPLQHPSVENEDFQTWSDKLEEKDIADLRTLSTDAEALRRAAQDVTKRGNPNQSEDYLRYTEETRDEFRLVENPGGETFPVPLRDAIDAAQKTIYYNNKPGGRFGDLSTQYGAVAEKCNGGRPLPGLSQLHIEKNEGLETAYADYITQIETLSAASAKHKPLVQNALRILRRELAKVRDAKKFCEKYTKTLEYPAWAKPWAAELDAYRRNAPEEKPAATAAAPAGGDSGGGDT